MQLRGYQIEMINGVYNAWREGAKNVLVQLATGAGKTVIMGKIISDFTRPSLAIAHRSELVSQISITLGRFGIKHNIIAQRGTIRDIVSIHHAEFKRSFFSPYARCTVASVDTLVKQPLQSWFNQVGLIIIDEAAHVLKKNKWGTVCAMFPQALGFFPTATPLRADGCGLGRYADGVIDKMLIGISMRELIDQGFLTDYRIFAPANNLDLTPIPVTASGEFSQAKLRSVMHKSKITGDVVSHYLKIAKDKQGITFTVDIESAVELAAEFRAAGVSAHVISSHTKDLERHAIMKRFRAREILQLVNVDILGEGVDVPAVEVVSMARPTQSYSLFAQQFGRALRPSPGKSHAIIIDHVNNCLRHGLPDMPRQWSLDRRERKTAASEPVIPLKTCYQCAAIFSRAIKECPYCSYINPISSRKAPEAVDGDLLELDAEVLAKLRGEAKRIMDAPKIPQGVELHVKKAIINRHGERREAQNVLRDNIAQWAGIYKAKKDDDATIYRRFWLKYNVDILTAQTLNARDAEALNERIAIDLLGNNC